MGSTATELKDRLAEQAAATRAATEAAERGEAPPVPAVLAALRDERQRAQIALSLPSTIKIDHFMRVVETTVKLNPDLLECTEASIMGACHRAAMLGLEPGPLGHCWFIPTENGKTHKFEVRFQLGYAGIIELAQRSDRLVTLDVQPVFRQDTFEFEKGLEEKLRHIPNLDVEPVEPKLEGNSPGRLQLGDLRFYWIMARFTNGGYFWNVVRPGKIEKNRLSSSSKFSPAWQNWYLEQARASMIRIHRTQLPLTYEAAAALHHDGEVISRMPAKGETYIDVEGDEVPPDEGAGDEDSAGDEVERCPVCSWPTADGHADGCDFE